MPASKLILVKQGGRWDHTLWVIWLPMLVCEKEKDLEISLDTFMGEFGESPCPISQQIATNKMKAFSSSLSMPKELITFSKTWIRRVSREVKSILSCHGGIWPNNPSKGAENEYMQARFIWFLAKCKRYHLLRIWHLGSVWILLIDENWKHCNKIIFKYVNSAVGSSFIVVFTEFHICGSREQCTGPKKNPKHRRNLVLSAI